jgi:histidinol dehydrogenase
MNSRLAVPRLRSDAADFASRFERLLSRDVMHDPSLGATVRDIVAAVAATGDAAVLDCTRRFDRRPDLTDAAQLELPAARLDQALAAIPADLRSALEFAAGRVERYHRAQLPGDWQIETDDGSVLGQILRPLERVGVYVPGGRASYPSSVLMNVLPARVAGVDEVVMTVPAPDGELNDAVLAAAAIAGVDRVFTVGGAQAVAAMAYGTATIPRVDKIVGPGNRFVAEAKRQVFGRVGIDMIAGPSEVLVIADASASAEWLACDLFAQAEHDEDAQSILLADDGALLDAVYEAMCRLLPEMPRRDIIRASLEARGALVQVRDLDEAVRLSNRVAPEHLELAVADPDALLPSIRHAGAVFVGAWSAEVLGDYCAGPSHVLPTSGTARFFSPLDVHDFIKRSSLLRCSPRGSAELARVAMVCADS